MKDGDTIGVLLLGGSAAVVSLLAWRSRRPASVTIAPVATTDGPLDRVPDRVLDPTASAAWSYPVPNLGERSAVTSSGFRAVSSGRAKQHLGADLMFRRRDTRDLIGVYPAGSPNGSPLFFMPDDVPALAASAGIVTFAAMTPMGNTVIVQHPSGWATYYTHLATLAVTKGQTVHAGQVIGMIGASPTDAEQLKHLLCGAAHKRCNAERDVMRSGRRRRAIPCNPRRLRLHITETSRRSR